jgi:23S rRNA (guanosine2251-2'-O)-methyltransferase
MPLDHELREELLGLAAREPDDPGVDARLAEILSGPWPGLRTVGAEATDAVWMLAHRADHLNDARRAWLPALAAAVASGDADPRHYATLADRAAAVAGEPQEFGTLAVPDAENGFAFEIPVREPDSLDERRTAIGLPPSRADAPFLADGGLLPYGPERGSVPVNQWPMVLEGHVSAEAVLEAGVRPVHRVWAVRPGDRRLGRLRALARERGVLIDAVDAATVDEVTTGRTHGGVIALVGPRVDPPLDELLTRAGPSALLVMLDGIEDPFNYGQAVRALYAAGTDGLVIRRSWETALGVVTRASAGTTELLPTAAAPSADDAAAAARAAGLRVVAAVHAPDATSLHDADLRGGVLVIIGGERRGVTRSLVSDVERVRIDYGRDRAPELGAATSAAIIGFEALRQRRT